MSGFSTDIETRTRENAFFRQVLFTGPNIQLVVMTLQPGEDIGQETHPHTDQFLRVEAGEARAVVDGQEHRLRDGSALVIPAGAEHNVINTSTTAMLKLYTLYAPPEHADGTIHQTKAEATEDHEH